MAQHRSPGPKPPAPRLGVRLTLGFGLAELAIWQLLSPFPAWPFALLTGIDPQLRMLIALMLLACGFVATLAWLRRHIGRPLHELATYVGEQSQRIAPETPATLPARASDIDNIRASIDRLIATLESQHAELLKQTLNDPLTGLGNRRLLEQRLATLLPLTRRLNTSLSLLMIDVDHFKAYNDYYGHPAGDTCLIEIANVLRATFRRETDVIIRLGGEEFLVVITDVADRDAIRLAEAMRSMLQLVGIPHDKSPTAATVTVSIGVATAAAGTSVGPDTLLACADECLYDCKADGRNRSAHRRIGDAQARVYTAPPAPERSDTVIRESA
ncbi:diguanylate cyclase [Salinisphaera sp. SPP-AMP-43]|uniref:diguanylate cyclase domain-containing protein n=1 Tax=Salinisphaera sp. SPP-AMP-43 TaxID=3121288 RepID=UPI003C6DDF91